MQLFSLSDTDSIVISDNVIYSFVDEIAVAVFVIRDNIIIDGAGYALQGENESYSEGLVLTDRSNVTIKNLNINPVADGIYFESSNNIVILSHTTHNYATTRAKLKYARH